MPDLERAVETKPDLTAEGYTKFEVAPLISGFFHEYEIHEPLIRHLLGTPECSQAQISTIMAQSTGRVDLTRDIPNLITSPDFDEKTVKADNLKILTAIGQEQLEHIANTDRVFPGFRREMFDALTGGPVTLRAILHLDYIQGQIISQLKEIRQNSEFAELLRQTQYDALVEYYRSKKDYHPLFQNLPHANTRSLQTGEPRIAYFLTTTTSGRVIGVERLYHIINIYKIPLANTTIGAIVEKATPEQFLRANESKYPPDPTTPVGLMTLVGTAGESLVLTLAKWIKQHQFDYQQAMNSGSIPWKLFRPEIKSD